MPDIDKIIGIKIKEIRKRWGLSQIDLAEKIDLSFQQVQKYEKGVTSISVHRLQQIAEALGVPLPHFFETKGEGPQAAGTTRTYRPTKTELHPEAPLTDEERTLLKQFRKLSNPKIKQGLIKQLQGLIELERKL